MNDSQGAKQQIVERIKSSSNILVTVSTDPSVDELSAALGLTIMLNNIDKHATAVVSGAIPPAITFLDPEKTFENTVDSLRDFIIALDKEKADHLRYKVDGDVVKIFITPYRTTITADDLEFSQGDYNVELVLALGVKTKEHLDAALTAHGRILHDATVATIGCNGDPSDLGSIDWTESNASSLSEMLVALSEALKGDKPLLDEQVATAFLTGIVAATDRFSNNRTSSKVMTMAAQLMAAGANQQLIAAKLEEAHEIGEDKDTKDDDQSNSDGTTILDEGKSTKLKKKAADTAPTEEKRDDGSLNISHDKEGAIEEAAAVTAQQNQSEAAKEAEDNLAKQLETVAPAAAKPSVADLQKDLAAASSERDKAAEQPAGSLPPVTPLSEQDAGPTMGGTLNATTEQAQKDKERELEDDRNKTILTHENGDYAGSGNPSFQTPFNAVSKPSDEPPSVDIFREGGIADAAEQPQPTPPTPSETLADIERQHGHKDDHADAKAAVAAAYDAAPFDPANNPQADIGARPLGEVSHDTATPPAAPVQQPPVSATPPALPPVPDDFSALPLPPPPPVPSFDHPQGPLPPEQLGQIFGSPVPEQPPAAPQPKDPNQFQIPNQR